MLSWREVPGLVSDDECETLQRLSKGKKCIEIGSWKGKTATCMASVAEDVTAIDTFKASLEPLPLLGQYQERNFTTLEEFSENIKGYKNINPCVGESKFFADLLPNGEYDLLFIDGMHDFPNVYEDVTLYISKLKDNGIVVFHDYFGNKLDGVTKTVDILFGKECVQQITRSLCWVYKKDFKKVGLATILTDGYVSYFTHFVNSIKRNCPEIMSLPMKIITGRFNEDLPLCSEKDKKNYIRQNGFSSGLSEANRSKVKRLFPNAEFKDMGLVERKTNGIIPNPHYWQIESFNLSEYDKLVYIDSDMLCLGDMTELLALNHDMGVWGNDGYDYNYGVFTVGKKFLNKETYEDILKLDPKEQNHHGCQDMLIDYFKDHMTTLPKRFNYMNTWLTMNSMPDDIVLLHYIYKPDTQFGRERLPHHVVKLWEEYE